LVLEAGVSNGGIAPGDEVCFHLADMHSPGVEEALNRLTHQAQLVGKVIFLSDAGERKGQFAIIEAEGVLIPIIVAVPQLAKIARFCPAQAAGLALASRGVQRGQ
jgi:hypothetical protein